MNRALLLAVVSSFLLTPGPLHAADDAARDKATTLLHKLQADVSTVPTTGTISLAEYKNQPITSNAPEPGWTTYFRYGDVHFRSRSGAGVDITPELDSIAVLGSDSLYLSLTVAPQKSPLASSQSYDLAPYLPGYRLYIYYRENLFAQEYQNDMRVTPTQSKIYRKITHDLTAMGIHVP
jgi:hypothetical protein